MKETTYWVSITAAICVTALGMSAVFTSCSVHRDKVMAESITSGANPCEVAAAYNRFFGYATQAICLSREP